MPTPQTTPNTWLKDRYWIESYIHQGGMGAVFRAKDRLKGRVVAVKESFYNDELLREQFIREATLLARLNHPALPEVTDYFVDGVGQFLVMQYIEGEDLENRLARAGGPLPLAEVLLWADTLLDALAYLHMHDPPVIHRDIKPSNIKLKPDGEIMLLDFGLAKNATTPTLPGGSVGIGTLAYAPLEQIYRLGTDGRSDLFALAGTLYHLLTNQPPLDARSRESTIRDHRLPDPLRPAHAYHPPIPPAISALLTRALALEREHRYPTAAAMRQALRAALPTLLVRPSESLPPTLKDTPVVAPTLPPTLPMFKDTRPATRILPLAPSAPASPPAKLSTRVRQPLIVGLVLMALAVSAGLGYFMFGPRLEMSGPSTEVTASPSVTPGPIPPEGPLRNFTEDLGAGVKLEMIALPGGTFLMGSNDGDDDEKPIHRVTLSPFWIGKYEVTQEQWKAVMGNNPSGFKGDTLPVENVSWEDAKKFCDTFSASKRKTYRLPTEAEWEYAARGGNSGKYGFGNDESLLGQYAWLSSNSGSQTHPVGQKLPNGFGLHDMHGNVWEWCLDWYGKDYYGECHRQGVVADPRGPAAGAYRVGRGGSWRGYAVHCRSAVRYHGAPGYRHGNLGFRLLRADR